MTRFVRTNDAPSDPARVAAIAARFGVSAVTARLLLYRGLSGDAQIDAFLHPEQQPLSDPLRIPGMARAADGVRAALRAGERICVYGDYDVDGVCATALLYRFLLRFTDNICCYIPSRHREGYGLNPDAIRRLHRDGVACLVTVDNGVSAVAEAALCRELGMRLLITDHHQCHAALPDADAVACSTIDGYDASVNALCGTGVAFQLCRALGLTDVDACLPLVALATVADVMPLTRENRTLVVRGLPLVPRVPGLKALLDVAGADGEPDAHTLSYVLAPRINAAGRIGSAMRALELMLTEEPAKARALAEELDGLNLARRAEELRIAEEAAAAPVCADADRLSLVLRGDDWNAGVIGIVASRLSERFDKPAILFTPQNGVLSGSGRSVPGVDLFALLCACAPYTVQFGGHAQAAGVSIREDAFDAFSDAFDRAVREQTGGTLPVRTVGYDEALSPSLCTLALCEELLRLAPFGEGNPEPAFLLSETVVKGARQMGRDGKHLSATVDDGGRGLRLVAFQRGAMKALLDGGEAFDLVVNLRANRYRGQDSCNAYLVDMAPCAPGEEDSGIKMKLGDAFLDAIRYNEVYGCADTGERLRLHTFVAPLHLSEDELRGRYVSIRNRVGAQTDKRRLWDALTARDAAALLIFLELGFFRLTGETVWAAESRPRPLTDSILFAGI